MSMTIGLQKPVSIGIRGSEPTHISLTSQKSVFVIFTSSNRTMKALEKAAELAKPLNAGIMMVAVEVVPYSLPLDRPPVPMEFVIKRFKEMVSQFPEKIRVFAYLCRDPEEAFKRILNPASPVVIGLRKRWWPTRDERLVRKLRRAGYDVISVETE